MSRIIITTAGDPSGNESVAKPALQKKHQVFISEMIAHGNRRLAYQAAYPDCSNNAARTCASRLLANPEIAARIQKGQMQARQLAIDELKEQYKGRITDPEEKRMVLARIIRCEIFSERETTNADGEKTVVKVPVNIRDLLYAIRLDNAMELEWKQALHFGDTGTRYGD